jgi:hypothetical protein
VLLLVVMPVGAGGSWEMGGTPGVEAAACMQYGVCSAGQPDFQVGALNNTYLQG